MAADTDNFVVATFALWAGDFAFADRLLRSFSPPHQVRSIDEGAEHPKHIIQATGALRLRQLRQKRGEFRKLAFEYGRSGTAISDTPTILETTHLRATLWRIGEREFLLQGYLKDLDWQDMLFKLASITADVERHAQNERGMFGPLGFRWALPGNPFLVVELTDLGLIEASGLWTAPALPQQAVQITARFQELLDSLDKPQTEQSL